jgi:hypothetical protein
MCENDCNCNAISEKGLNQLLKNIWDKLDSIELRLSKLELRLSKLEIMNGIYTKES